MSDTYTDTEPQELSDEELEAQVTEPVPLVQMLMLDGGYFGATISLAGDPEAPNLAEQVKTRLLLAHDGGALDSRITSCLIADYGLTQDDAEAVPRLTMIEGAPTEVEPGPEEIPPEEPEPEPPVDPPMVQPTTWDQPKWEEPQREA
jgi:hypothetical protein